MHPNEANEIEAKGRVGDPKDEDEKQWFICCSKSSVQCVKYFSQLSVIAFSIIFSSIMLILHPYDLEIRSGFLPLLSGSMMLLINPPTHD